MFRPKLILRFARQHGQTKGFAVKGLIRDPRKTHRSVSAGCACQSGTSRRPVRRELGGAVLDWIGRAYEGVDFVTVIVAFAQ
jgi:hypothetical protein